MATHSSNPLSQNDSSGPPNDAPDAEAATELIREKVARVFAEEPDAKQELDEAEAAKRRSKHQQFMHKLSTSGKDAAAIQTEWHTYYQKLPDHEKHKVWQEFYESQPSLTTKPQIKDAPAAAQALSARKHQAAKPRSTVTSKSRKLRDARSKTEVQRAIRHKVSAGGKLQAKHHVQSLLFGLGMGLLVLIIFLFGFFNEVIIAPFIQPSRAAASGPLIVSNTISANATPQVIIPKINVEIPVDYSQTSIDEATLQKGLENGVVHYPTTVLPGQNGNSAFFGHSSNNIFNKGKYKFAFVLLHELQNGDTFYLTYSGKVYVYKVISKTVVDPSQVGVLGPVAGQAATATLITCDPPGTNLRRLVVVGQQISPDPTGNAEGATASTGATGSSTDLPGNGPTLLGRVMSTTLGKAIAIIIIVAGLFLTIRWVNKPKRALQI
jgi:LPXTG-site transpeptidase (sortase) family protein